LTVQGLQGHIDEVRHCFGPFSGRVGVFFAIAAFVTGSVDFSRLLDIAPTEGNSAFLPFGVVGILFAYCEVIHNSLLMAAAGPRHAPHASGLALRFPRIIRLRRDKSDADIDTLATARRLLPAAE
jgi:hypothetical protein